METTDEARSQQTRRRRRRWLWLAVVPVVAVAWWLGSPLFLDDEVNEAFPVVSTTAAPAESATPTTAAPESVEGGEDSPVSTQAPTPTTTPPEPEPLVAGSFEGFDAVHQGSGSATIFDVGDSTVVRFEDFDVTNGPDLRVNLVLSDGSMIDLGALKGNVGDQNYDIPSDIDVATIESVLIYCRAFSVPFAEAGLS